MRLRSSCLSAPLSAQQAGGQPMVPYALLGVGPGQCPAVLILHSTPCGRLVAEATQLLCGRLAVGWSIELGPRRGGACLEAARRGGVCVAAAARRSPGVGVKRPTNQQPWRSHTYGTDYDPTNVYHTVALPATNSFSCAVKGVKHYSLGLVTLVGIRVAS